MTISLVTLRQQQEHRRFARQQEETVHATPSDLDPQALAAELRRAVAGEVRFTNEDRALYATDGSNYRQVPIGVVVPRDRADVVRTIELCRQFGAPLLSRGGGTSLAGQCCNTAVIMDFSKYVNRVLQIDPERRLATIEPGCVLDDLRNAAEKHHLTFGPDPETHNHCTLGGMLGNNSCGVHSLLCTKAGLGLRTSDNTHQLDLLTYDGLRLTVGPTSDEELAAIIRAGGRRGQIYADLKALRDTYADLIRQRYPKIPRRVSGYNLDDLLPEKGFHVARALVGSESTCVTILQATMHLVPSPAFRSLLALGYPSIYEAGDHVMEILQFMPTGLEGVDHLLFEWVHDKGDKNANLSLLPEGYGFLLVEFGGASKQDSDNQARHCMEMLKKQPHPPTMRLIDNPKHEEMIWKVRQGSLGSTAWVPGHADTWEGFEDSAVPPDRVGDYLREFKKVLDKHGYAATSLYGHLGQGCVHCRIPFDFYTAAGVRNYRAFMEDATNLVIKFGGSYSGEHGDGQSRAEFLPKLFGEELMTAMRQFKRIWDPNWKMNPGKVVNPYSVTDNLRLGPDYNPPQPQTHFQYPADQHTFSRAVLRCVGIGECRRHGGQVMCPSYMVTREEKHCTRGRARLLWEMMNGDVLTGGWKSEAVKDALDLCLSCKGCKHDCPVNVDMATYKAEFLSHYYQGRLRPRHAYAFGYVHAFASLVHAIPGLPALANVLARTPGISALAKFLAGMAPQRSIPAFAPMSFQKSFRDHRSRHPNGPPVILFPDTFNNFFHADIAMDAVDVLEQAGFNVRVPMQNVCCGRPFYDYGMLDQAKAYLRHIAQVLAPAIEDETPIVVLEPSCCAVFRDELTNVFPNEWWAKRLRGQVFLLSEFLAQKAPSFRPPQMPREALVHMHCHHRAIMGIDDEQQILDKMHLQTRIPDQGCCGMAGSFGFEPGDHYRVSVACGQRQLVPAVDRTASDTLLIANGFSCQEQIAQQSGRHALHLAQVLKLALDHRDQPLPAGPPEAPMLAARAAAQRTAATRALVTLGAVTLAAVAAWRLLSPRSRSIPARSPARSPSTIHARGAHHAQPSIA